MGISPKHAGRAEALWLCALLVLLPFEPRRPTLPVLGFETTLLEAAAALAGVALLWLARQRLPDLLRRPPLPLAFLACCAAAHLLSAALAEDHRDAALKFALRMCVMAGFALVVAALRPATVEKGLVTLAATTGVVAVAAILEGSGVRALDPVLSLFREMPFNVAGVRRASAGSEYPNLAAAFLMYGLLAGVGLATGLTRALAVVIPWAALLSVALAYTYSRGALLAAAAGLAALGLAFLGGDRRRARAPVAALMVLLLLSATFASAGEVFRLRLETEGTGNWYGAAYAPAEGELVLSPGESRATPVRVTNSGLKTWSAAEAFNLSYHWYDPQRRWLTDGGRTALPKDLAQGDSAVLRPEVRAPEAEGRYLLLWDMVHEHTTWFSGQGVRPGVVSALVTRSGGAVTPGAAPPQLGFSLAWRPGRAELWSLALGMWRDHPWLGVGPDNYRRLYGRRAGRVFWDPRVYANNAFLEAAATTGTLGLVAFAGTLAASGVAAWRGLAAPQGRILAPALLALVVGVAAHGLVDYVLAFTGHYLVLGMVAGAASGLARQEALA